MIKLDISVDDILLTGKFRNKKTIVKKIGTDEHGSPTVNGKSILNCRIEKLMKKEMKKSIKESKYSPKDLLKIKIIKEQLEKITGKKVKFLSESPESDAEGYRRRRDDQAFVLTDAEDITGDKTEIEPIKKESKLTRSQLIKEQLEKITGRKVKFLKESSN